MNIYSLRQFRYACIFVCVCFLYYHLDKTRMNIFLDAGPLLFVGID